MEYKCKNCKFYDKKYLGCKNQDVKKLVKPGVASYSIDFHEDFGCIYFEYNIMEIYEHFIKFIRDNNLHFKNE